MNLEIERKWLISSIPEGVTHFVHKHDVITQGYLADVEGAMVRVRHVKRENGLTAGYITVKSPSDVKGAVGEEEMTIPSKAAESLLKACPVTMRKVRHYIPHMIHIIELDFFKDALSGLVVAEVEFVENDDPFEVPDWFGVEVTDDKQFANIRLIKNGLPQGYDLVKGVKL